MNTEPNIQGPADSPLPSASLLAAVELACDKWDWIRCGTREPISITMKRPENEMRVFEMVIAMNNLRSKMQKFKAANEKCQLPAGRTQNEP